MASYNTSANETSQDNVTSVIGGDYDYYTEDQMKSMIMEHISPKFYHWIFLVIFFSVFFVGTVGNFLVCYSVWKCNQLKTVTNFFLVNLAAADFLVILICLPATISYELIQSWFLGLVMCKLITYLQRVSVFVSVLTLTCISVERYLAICHPLTYHSNSFKTRLVLAIIWTIGLLTPCLDFYNMYLKHDEQVPVGLRPWMTSCTVRDNELEMYFNIIIFVLFFALPLFVMSYAYTRIAKCLWSSTSTGNAASEHLQHESAMEQLRVRRRTAKMLIIVVITFGLCYFPIFLLNVIRFSKALDAIKDNHDAMFCLFWTSRLLGFFNSAINPVIYNFMSVKFRKQFRTACVGCYSAMSCCFKSDTSTPGLPVTLSSHLTPLQTTHVQLHRNHYVRHDG